MLDDFEFLSCRLLWPASKTMLISETVGTSSLKVSGLGKAITSTTGFGTYTKRYDRRQGEYFWQSGVNAISRAWTGKWYIGHIHYRFTAVVSVEKNEKYSLCLIFPSETLGWHCK